MHQIDNKSPVRQVMISCRIGDSPLHVKMITASFMMTSSNGNIFRVTGFCAWNSPVIGISLHKGQWRAALMFLRAAPEPKVEQTMETPVICDTIALWCHCNVWCIYTYNQASICKDICTYIMTKTTSYVGILSVSGLKFKHVSMLINGHVRTIISVVFCGVQILFIVTY